MVRAERLAKNYQFTAVFEKGRTLTHELIVLRAMPNGTERSRLGFVVSKKVGNAVVRNKVRRKLREIFRLLLLNSGWDVVVIARKKVAVSKYGGLESAVLRTLHRGGLLEENK